MDQYNKLHVGPSFVGVNINSSNNAYVDVSRDKPEDNDTQFRKMFYQHVEKVNDLQCRFKLDRYLHYGPIAETKDFDILDW
jgi:hypothetical protein